MKAGLKLIWPEVLNIVNESPAWKCDTLNSTRQGNDDYGSCRENCANYLTNVLLNPLSLKENSRIIIRNRLIGNMKHNQFIKDYVLSNPRYQLNSANEPNRPSSPVTTGPRNAVVTSNQTHRQQTSSILQCLIWQLDLPTTLHFYLYAFPDVPPIPEDTVYWWTRTLGLPC